MEDALISKTEKNWAMFAHLSPLLGYIGVPLVNIIAPLVIWQLKKNDMPFVVENAKECLNFQISVTIYALICLALVFVAIGFFLLIPLSIAAVILTVMAGVKANSGVSYRYPLTIRFIK